MKSLPLLLLLAIFLVARPAGADTVVATPITHLPYVIAHAGTYRLAADLTYTAATGAAIVVESNQVQIDLNGWQLGCSNGSGNTAIGIYTSGPQEQVTVHDGNVVGFGSGVVLIGNSNRVSDLLLRNYFNGISMTGNNIEISHNRVATTGGGDATKGLSQTGISLSGSFGVVSGNDVQSTFAPDLANRTAAGIRLSTASYDVVSNNRVLSVQPIAPATSATSTGILAQTDNNLTVTGNVVDGAETGFDFTGTTMGEYENNISFGTGTAYVAGGMTDAGNNK